MENYENKNNEIDVKLIISKNIIKYRKKNGAYPTRTCGKIKLFR